MIKMTVLFALALVVVSAAAAYLYGSRLPEERTIVRSAQIGASPELVYDVAVDAEGQRSWRSDVSDITMRSDGRGWIEHTRQGDVEFELTHEERPRTFGLRFIGDRGFEGSWTGEFRANAAGTEATLTETTAVRNPFFRLLSRVMKFSEKFMDRYIRDLKTEAEKRRLARP